MLRHGIEWGTGGLTGLLSYQYARMVNMYEGKYFRERGLVWK
jgi:hypothetical protein